MAHTPDGDDQLRNVPSGTASPPGGPVSPHPGSGQPARADVPFAGQPAPPPPTQHAPPPRPGLSYSAPAPIAVIPPAPGSIRHGRSLWLASFLAGLAVLVGSFFTRDGHLERLRGVVEQMAPGGDAEAVTTATGIVFWGSIGALLLVTVLEAAMLGVVMGRQGWARWALVPLLIGHALVMLVATAFLVPDGDGGSYVLLLWGAELLLALIGLVMFFLPASNAWLKSSRPS
ncbi:hypothetical protein [Arthrobacter sp. AD-310]